MEEKRNFPRKWEGFELWRIAEVERPGDMSYPIATCGTQADSSS